jgi:gas vesicle protein
MTNDNERPQERGGGGFFAGFLVGALVGGAIAMLISQEETRDLIVGKAREAGNLAMDAGGDLRGKVADVAGSFQTSASDLYSRGKEVVDNARSNIDAAVDEGKTTADAMREDLSRNSSDL